MRLYETTHKYLFQIKTVSTVSLPLWNPRGIIFFIFFCALPYAQGKMLHLFQRLFLFVFVIALLPHGSEESGHCKHWVSGLWSFFMSVLVHTLSNLTPLSLRVWDTVYKICFQRDFMRFTKPHFTIEIKQKHSSILQSHWGQCESPGITDQR